MHAGQAQIMSLTLFPQVVESVARLVDRNIKLPAELTDIRHSSRVSASHAELDRMEIAKRKILGGEVVIDSVA